MSEPDRPIRLRPDTIEQLLAAVARLDAEGPDAIEIIGTSAVMRDIGERILALEHLAAGGVVGVNGQPPVDA